MENGFDQTTARHIASSIVKTSLVLQLTGEGRVIEMSQFSVHKKSVLKNILTVCLIKVIELCSIIERN